MASRDARVDAYIAKAREFARPVLIHLRDIVHAACPDVEETMKWSFPHFTYAGGILCSMASFNEHCAFGFWKASLILDKDGRSTEAAMGQFGRLTSVKDLPAKKVLAGYVKQAMELNEQGVTVPKKKPAAKGAVVVPEDLKKALARNKQAAAAFTKFSPSHQREYVTWITEAKSEVTRERRLVQALEWLVEGKARNWKYEKC